MTSEPQAPDDPEQLKAEIERTRERLGRTAEALVAKADVKARAQARVTGLTQRAKSTATAVRRQAAAQAGSARGQLGKGRDQLQSQAPGLVQIVIRYRTQLIIAGGALMASAVVIRVWTGH